MTNFSNYFNSKENKKDFFIAIIVIVLFVTLGGYLMTNNNFEVIEDLNTSIISQKKTEGKTNTTSNVIAPVDQKIINAPHVVSWIDSLEYNEIKNTSTKAISEVAESNLIASNIDNTIAETESSSKEVTDELDSSNKPKINLNFNGSDEKETPSLMETKTELESTKKKEKSQEEVKTNIKPVKKDPIQTTEIKKTAPIIKKEAITKTKCVVILGAFSNQTNLNNLKKKVLKDYSIDEIYLGKRKGYNVLGLHVNCANAENKLNSLRNKYVKKAWLLKLK